MTTTDAKIAKAHALAKHLANHYLSVRRKIATFERFVADDVTDIFKDSHGGHILLQLRLVLVVDLIREVFALILDAEALSSGTDLALADAFSRVGLLRSSHRSWRYWSRIYDLPRRQNASIVSSALVVDNPC